jgi:hypothetical protein
MNAKRSVSTAAPDTLVGDVQEVNRDRREKLRACQLAIGHAGPYSSAHTRPWTKNHTNMTIHAGHKHSLLELGPMAVYMILEFLDARDVKQLVYTHLKFLILERNRHDPPPNPSMVEKRYCRSSDITVVYSSLPVSKSKAWPWFAMATVRDAALPHDDRTLTAYFIKGRDAEALNVLDSKSTHVVVESTFRTCRDNDAADKKEALLVRTLRLAPPMDATDLFWTLDTNAALAKMLQQWHATPRSMRDPALAGKMAVRCLDRGILSFPTGTHSMILDFLPQGDQEQLTSMFEKCRLALRQLRGETEAAQEWRYCCETNTTVVYYRDRPAVPPEKYFATAPVSVPGTSHVTLQAYFAEGRLLHVHTEGTRIAPLSPYVLTMRATFRRSNESHDRKANTFAREGRS